jgi:5'(3')-deoxyribonucleotidase
MAPSEKPKLCVDIDNVLAQTDAVMREIIRVATVSKENPSGIWYEYEDITHFEYDLCTNSAGLCVSKQVWNAVHQLFQDPNSGYVDLIRPMAGALEGLNTLAERWDIWIVTSRHSGALKKASDWVERHFPGFSRNVRSSYQRKGKWEVSPFQAAVDDHLETAVGFANLAVRSFVYTHPWNRGATADGRLTIVADWPQLVRKLDASLGSLTHEHSP